MNIVVCIKQVPDTAEVRINPETGTLIREGVPSIINPFDLHAVEAGLFLKEKTGGKVTVLTMGPPMAEAALRKAISYGADDAVLVTDRAFAGSDTLATSCALASAITQIHKDMPVDLVFTGKQTIDGDTAQVGPGIASRLKFAQLTLVDRVVEIHKEKKIIVVRRALEDRYEIIESKLPAMITVVRECNLPRYPTVPGRLEAAEVKPPVWTNDILKLDPNTIGLNGSPTQVRRIFAPQREKGEIIEGEAEKKDAAVDAIFGKLRDWDFVTLEK